MLFGSSGIRRTFDQTLLEIALKVGSALASGSSEIIVGRDTRTTSPLLSNLVAAGILGSGGDLFDAGLVPTPSVAFGTREVKAGCMVTASHNPERYNGLKLFNPDGSSFTKNQQEGMERLLEAWHWTDWKHQGTIRAVDAITPHKRAILERTTTGKEMVTVIDCGNGAGCTLTPSLLSESGARTICLNCDPSGRFARPSEPLKEHLGYVGEIVRKKGATCAVVHDGDADRMMAFDNRGRYVEGDHLLMLFARYLDARRVVTTSDASMLIENFADVRRTPVGDSYVSEELLKWGDFGGEPSGAWIFPEISLCPDGPFAAALFCEIASEWDVAREIDSAPVYSILRESLVCATARRTVIALGAENPTDGIRIADEEGWYLIRASGTEDKIRITAEGKNRKAAQIKLEEARTLLKKGKTA
ncbi:MAG: phosphopentomutase/phosphoglucosamine mutase [Methanoregula sp.]|nr:phosphopentomutase/phosphoglucosamine mutase [Methanoregula sp.]